MNLRSILRRLRHSRTYGRLEMTVRVPHALFPEPCPHFEGLHFNPADLDLSNGILFAHYGDDTAAYIHLCEQTYSFPEEEIFGRYFEAEETDWDGVPKPVWWTAHIRRGPWRKGVLEHPPVSHSCEEDRYQWVKPLLERYRAYVMWGRQYLNPRSELPWFNTRLGYALLDAGGMAGDSGGHAVPDPEGVTLRFGVKACRARATLLDFAKALKRIGQEAERVGLRVRIR